MTVEYGTRPYAEKDGDELQFVDRMQRNTYFNQFRVLLEKHSELMKPYADDWDFPQMEQFAPGDFKNPDQGPSSGVPEADANKGVCVITCYAPLYCDDPVECHFNRLETPPGMDPREAMAHVWMTAKENLGDGTGWNYVGRDRVNMQVHLTKKAAKEDIERSKSAGGQPHSGVVTKNKARNSAFPMNIDAPTGGWAAWPDSPMTKLRVVAMDPAKNLCETELNVFCRRLDCCLKPGYIAVSIDDSSTPDTIAPGGSITVYVANGCPPYFWQVSGQGYSFATSTTDGLTNVLSLVNGTCGTGAGQAAPVGTVTVIDKCGNSTTALKIRSTGGTWKDKGTAVVRFQNDCNYDCYSVNCSGSCSGTAYEEIVYTSTGVRKWEGGGYVLTWHGCLPANMLWCWDGTPPIPATGDNLPPFCNPPGGCSSEWTEYCRCTIVNAVASDWEC